jgi:hypothetical protein
MTNFHLAWRSASREQAEGWLGLGLPSAPPCALSGTARLAWLEPRASHSPAQAALAEAEAPGSLLDRLGPDCRLACFADPAALTLVAAARPPARHYFRLADATVKPLPPTPLLLHCLAGDCYVAVMLATAEGSTSAALARFIHLRDYFNAEALARALLEHLADLDAASAGVLVIEAR